jgi:hypothetical protein
LSKQAVCVKAKAPADRVYQRRTWDEFKRVLSAAHARQPVAQAENVEYRNILSGVCWGAVYCWSHTACNWYRLFAQTTNDVRNWVYISESRCISVWGPAVAKGGHTRCIPTQVMLWVRSCGCYSYLCHAHTSVLCLVKKQTSMQDSANQSTWQ